MVHIIFCTSRDTPSQTTIRRVIMAYIITGRAAHGRVGNLFQKLLKEEEEEHDLSLIDKSPYATTNNKINLNDALSCKSASSNDNDIVFLWENAPRSETKCIRDIVKCYSHLPVSSIMYILIIMCT